jgi:hypothetical protein
MIDGSYMRHALATALRVARFDRQAIAGFDQSFEGFYRSFFGIVLCAPFYILIILAERRMASDPATAMPELARTALPPISTTLLTVETLTYLASWLTFPLLMIVVVRLIGATARYVPFIVAYNWTSCIILGATVIPYALYLTGAISLAGILALYYPIAIYTLIYRWGIARDGLQISSLTAMGIVILDFLLSIFVALAAARLRGGL